MSVRGISLSQSGVIVRQSGVIVRINQGISEREFASLGVFLFLFFFLSFPPLLIFFDFLRFWW